MPRLTSTDLRLLVSRYVGGQSAAVIAADLGVSKWTVYYHLRRTGTALHMPERSPALCRCGECPLHARGWRP